MVLYLILVLTLTGLMMKTWWKEKRPWEEATLLFSSCSTLPYPTLRSFPSKCLILLLQVSILLLHPIMSSGAQIPEMSSKTYQQWDSPGTISIHLCNCKENGLNIPRQFAALTRQDGVPTKLLLRIYPKKTASSICMKCVHTGMATAIIPCSTSLEDVKSLTLQRWLSRQTLEMEL